VTLERALFERRHSEVVFALVLLAVLFVPIPLGSNRPYAWFGFQTYVYGVLALWALGSIMYSGPRPLSSAARRILAVFAIWLGLLYVETVSLPGAVVETLNPLVYSLQQDLALVNIGTAKTLSIDKGSTLNEFLKYGSYVAVFGLALATINSRSRLLIFVGVVVFAGILEAIFGLYSRTTGFIIFSETQGGQELRAGTFVNRNHYSNMLLMVLGLVFGLLASISNAQDPERRLRFWHYTVSAFRGWLSLLGVALFVLLAVLVFHSTMPIIIFAGSFVIVSMVVSLHNRDTQIGEYLLIPLVILAVVIALVTMGLDKNMFTVRDGGASLQDRMLQNLIGLKILSSVWLAGVGAGNYRWVFPMYRDDSLQFATYDHAHNDYLQGAIEQGVFVEAVMGGAVFLVVLELLKGYKRRRNPVIRGVIFGCLISTVFMLLHSMVEFNFRIPANAVYFFAIAAIGIAACRIDRGSWKAR
jgi:O-antigen ligase